MRGAKVAGETGCCACPTRLQSKSGFSIYGFETVTALSSGDGKMRFWSDGSRLTENSTLILKHSRSGWR